MSLNFEPIALDRQEEYLDRFSQCAQKSSEYSFVNLWGWAEEHGLCWAWSDELVWIQQNRPETIYWAPVGPWEHVGWNKCLDETFSGRTLFARIPETLFRIWEKRIGQRIAAEESREHWDYLYAVDDLIALGGKSFHKKKNLLNQFRKKYDFEYVPFETAMIEMAMGMQEDWCTWRDCESSESLSSENRAISRTLDQWENLKGIMGGALIVEEKMAAYTIAESLAEDTLVVHFEKGSPDYKGVYQAVNQMFLEHSGGNFKIVNREQDLGDEGLRKAKLSYNPIDFLKKYRVVWS
ncbi:MAG: phosphatidylglycerol lysyltransferase domain-containing protein [Pseudomonadota bacterium]